MINTDRVYSGSPSVVKINSSPKQLKIYSFGNQSFGTACAFENFDAIVFMDGVDSTGKPTMYSKMFYPDGTWDDANTYPYAVSRTISTALGDYIYFADGLTYNSGSLAYAIRMNTSGTTSELFSVPSNSYGGAAAHTNYYAIMYAGYNMADYSTPTAYDINGVRVVLGKNKMLSSCCGVSINGNAIFVGNKLNDYADKWDDNLVETRITGIPTGICSDLNNGGGVFPDGGVYFVCQDAGYLVRLDKNLMPVQGTLPTCDGPYPTPISYSNMYAGVAGNGNGDYVLYDENCINHKPFSLNPCHYAPSATSISGTLFYGKGGTDYTQTIIDIIQPLREQVLNEGDVYSFDNITWNTITSDNTKITLNNETWVKPKRGLSINI